ncbi:MAG: Tm-1-like ATP-binding domain-containing protein, partial [candidate division Zixibacteria bacterium]|nr:Tm-1-like ATP-binding domain-containing protein [candidate division Zixibacteria bacterium]
MPKTIVIVGALDTKGDEFAFVKAEIERRGHDTLIIDTGVIGDAAFEADVSNEQVAEAAGTTIDALKKRGDRGEAIDAMAAGVAEIVQGLYEAGVF